MLPFLILNLSVPIYLRLRQPAVPFYARWVGFLEDVFVALELFLLAAASVELAAALGFLIHVALLLDSFLFDRMGLRLRFSYLVHLNHARSFYSSAKELGLRRLIMSGLAAAVLHALGYFTVYRHLEGISIAGIAAAAGVGAAAILSARAMPKKVAYAFNNLFFDEQVKFFRRKNRANNTTVPAPVFSSSESYHLLDENYPLLRMTKEFKGEKQFEVKIGAEEKPHVVLIFLESFSAQAVGYEKKATPNFDRLAQEGIFFSNFYSNGTFTYRAQIAGLFGVPAGSTAEGLAPYVNVPFVGMPQLMKHAGYTSAFFHNGSLSYDRQDEFLKHHFDVRADRSNFEDSLENSTSWGVHDEHLMRYAADWLGKQQGPAFMTLFTISNHHPWVTPPHHVPPAFDSFFNPSHKRFLQTTHYTDYALGLLVDLLKAKDLSKNTVLIIVGDHAQPLGQHQGNFFYSRFLYEENVRVPLLIVAEGRIPEPKIIDEIGSHTDLLPTLMDLLHLRGVQHGCGASLMRKAGDRTAMLHNPYAEGFLGCRSGRWKWIEDQLTLEGELYDLAADAEEKNNLATAYPAVADAMRKNTQEYFRFIYDLHAEGKITPLKTEVTPPPPALSFNLTGSMITDEELIRLASASPDLEKLKLRDCLLVSDEGIAAILLHCTRLQELNLTGITDLTDGAFENGLPALRPSLRRLDIPDASISDHGVEKVVKCCPNLLTFSFRAHHLTDRGIQAVGHFCRRLVRLKILQAEQISEEALLALLNSNRRIAHLVVQGCPHLTDRFLESLQHHPLEFLWIFDAPLLTDKGVASLVSLPIRYLTLEGCPLLTDQCNGYLSQMNLESVYLNCQDVTKAHL